jgi:putative membrane protein
MTVSPEQPDAESRARTHLANERTFLAWFRTGITLIALGIAAAQFLTYEASGGIPLVEVLASILVVSGIGVTLIGAWRYLTGRDRIDVRDFRPAYHSILATTAAAIVVGAVAIIFVWLLRPS